MPDQPGGEPVPSDPRPAAVEPSLLTPPEFACLLCGLEGCLRRVEAEQLSPLVFVDRRARLLLPYCVACASRASRAQQCSIEAALVHDTRFGLAPGVTRAISVACPVPYCSVRTHPVSAGAIETLPLGAVVDAHGQTWHPCPWCFMDDPGGAVVTQQAARCRSDDFGMWERELRRA